MRAIQLSPPSPPYHPLLSLSQTNSAIAQVIDAVPLPQERITQDGQRTHRLREVHSHEGADAGSLDLQSVVIRANGEVVAAQGESDVGQRGTLLTVNRVLAGEALLGTDLGVTSEIVSKSVGNSS